MKRALFMAIIALLLGSCDMVGTSIWGDTPDTQEAIRLMRELNSRGLMSSAMMNLQIKQLRKIQYSEPDAVKVVVELYREAVKAGRMLQRLPRRYR